MSNLNIGGLPFGDTVNRRIKALEKKVAQLEGARRLEAASIGAGGLTVRGGGIYIEDANGNLLLTLDADGLTATPLGLIGNGALASPVSPAVANQESSAVFTSGVADYATTTVPVPTDYTTALVHLTCTATAGLGQISGDAAFSVAAIIDSHASAEVHTDVVQAGQAGVTASLAWSGTVSGSVSLATRVDVNRGASRMATCGALTSATILFLR